MFKSDFIKYLKQLKPDDWNVQVTDKWTVKDVVAHMVGWEAIDPAAIRESWRTKKRPWFYETDDYDIFNQKCIDKYGKYAPRQLIAMLEKFQALVREEINRIGEDNLRKKPRIFGWLFEREEDKGSHYNHHLEQIRNAIIKA